MKNVFIRLVAAVLLTALTATAALAQGPPANGNHIISLGIGGGVSVPVSDAADAFKSGTNGQGFVRWNLGAFPIRPRVDFTFQHFDLKTATVSGASIASASTGSLLAGLASVEVPLLHGRIEPYLVAGVGAYDVTAASVSKTQFGLNGGAGLLCKLGMLALYAEGRVDNVYTDKGFIDTNSIQVVPVTFGIEY